MMTTTGATAAATGNAGPPGSVGVVVGAGPVGVVVGGPVGVVVGPVDGGDVDNEIGVGSVVGIPTTQQSCNMIQ